VAALSFGPSSAALDEEAVEALDRLAERLATEDDGWYHEVRGHADGSGSEEANLRLGRARAESVRRYLHEEKGVPLDRLGVVSLGSSAPVADDGTPEGRSQNRRAEVLLLR
jgi:outer membrane protein OmpA-like peptidoglycan-associated protein